VEHSIANEAQRVVTGITEQLARLRARIEAAAAASGRSAADIRILAVSKTHPAARVQELLSAGLADFGENYLQEALEKISAVAGEARWHFIGGIQSNKTRAIAEHFDWVQTVSSPRIAERLSRQRPEDAADLQALIQIRPAGAPQRYGAAQTELANLAEVIECLPRLRLRGLMIMPVAGQDDAGLRAEFARARELWSALRSQGYGLDTLSMGMSGDLEAAIMEGSTMVRVGTALFGPRM
jgi:pyridoxal phosphate enzyme (YggS family)